MTDEPDHDLLDTPPAGERTPPGAATATIASDAPTVEMPGAPTAPPPERPPSPPVPADSAPRRRGVLVPAWLLMALAALGLFGVGMLVGSAIGGDDHGGARTFERPANGFRVPGNANNGRSGPGNGFGRQPDQRVVPSPGQGDNALPPGGSARPDVFLGVGIADSSNPAGASVTRIVTSSPAQSAGLRTGDVITGVDGTSVKSAAALSRAIRAHAPGDTVTIRYSRDGTTATATATLSGGSSVSQQ